HSLTRARIASTSSGTMVRSTTKCPAALMRSVRVAPDLSSAICRVSETVRTANLSGTNCLLSSIPSIALLLLEIERMAGVARDSERPVETLDLVGVLRAAQFVGRIRGCRRPPIKICKIGPNVRRRYGVGRGIAIG